MKVIFIQNVSKHGQIGEIKNVADGFAVNVLIPKKQVVIATDQAIKKIEDAKKNKEFKKELDKNLFLRAILDLQKILDEEKDKALILSGYKSDAKGNLFSQIKENDIIDAIYKKIKISLNPGQVILPKDPIKKLGIFEIEVKDKDNKRKLKILVK
ncbi:MAG: 50S ribosomal protein L9 [Candidatus Pacebacteria bacterium]|nr:50S ribosomal protein L9 [Candidatus Paceibacterota bacterium]